MNPAVGLLAQMLAGVQHPAHVPADEPTLSAEAITADGADAVETRLVMPSGDKFLVRVEWLRAESP